MSAKPPLESHVLRDKIIIVTVTHCHASINNFSSNKALEMSDMVHELRKGVEKVAEKVLYVLYECQNEIQWEVFYLSPVAPQDY